MIATYQRISRADGDLGKDGKDKSNSIENQKEMIQRYISHKESLQNLPVMDFVDDGYTGSNFDRPGFQKMMDGVRSGEIDTIIVKDLSRFGRDYIGVGEYMEQIFPLLGVRLISVNDNYDSNNYNGATLGMDLVVSNLVNTMYCRDAGKKLRTANRVKWRKGISTASSAPFGYQFDPNKKGSYDYKQASPIFWCREGQELIGQTKCSSEIFQANDIENAVFRALKKELSLLGSLYGDIKKEEQSLKEASRKASRRKTSMEQELKNLKGEKMRMYEEYAAGTLSLDNYKNKKQEYDRKIAEVQDKIEQSKAEEAAQSVVPGTVRAAAEQAENFLHGTRLTASMVSAFIENVYVHEGGRIVVRFKYEQSIQDAVRALHTE